VRGFRKISSWRKTTHLQLSGRLGNQLFELSFAHELSSATNTRVQLFFDRYHFPHGFSDDLIAMRYNCNHVSSPTENNLLGGVLVALDKLNSLKKFQTYRKLLPKIGIYRQLDSHIAGPSKLGKPFLVSGFFIDKKYPEKFASQILPEIESILEETFNTCSLRESVLQLGKFQLMHIRRGDFVNNQADFGLLSEDYYEKLRSELPLILAIESDGDLGDFKKRLKPELIISRTNASAWETLAIMSKASDLVLSNSTFSWWGGFFALQKKARVRIGEPFYKNRQEIDAYLLCDGFEKVKSEFL
jgi:hypothetical protein